MSSIKQTANKIKEFVAERREEIGLIALIILVALISFSLGKLSAIEENRPEVKITHSTISSSTECESSVPKGAVVVSRYGEAYHYPWCTGAERIDADNRKWFSSIKKAKEAGYRPAKNCKGLK